MADHVAARKRQGGQASARRHQVLKRHADQTLQVAAVEHRTERTERARALRSRQESDAAGFTAETAAEVARLTGLLRAAAVESPRDLDWFRRNLPEDAPPTLDDVAAPTRPEWSQYAPPPPGLFGRRRHERSLLSARADLDDALARHDRALKQALAELMAQHRARAERARRAHETTWDDLAAAVKAADPDAIGTYACAVLEASPGLRGLIEGGRATYETAG